MRLLHHCAAATTPPDMLTGGWVRVAGLFLLLLLLLLFFRLPITMTTRLADSMSYQLGKPEEAATMRLWSAEINGAMSRSASLAAAFVPRKLL